MAKINNLDAFPEDLTITDKDYLIGSSWDDNGRTKNYKVTVLAEFIAAYIENGNTTPIVQNNKTIVEKSNDTDNNNIENVWDAVNNKANFSVADDEIYLFEHIYNDTSGGTTSIVISYWWFLRGKGNYGVGGTAVSEGNFFLMKTNNIVVEGEDPVVYYLNHTNISNASEAVNNSSESYSIANGDDVYFVIRPSFLLSQKRIGGKIYRFVGDAGTYGNGGSTSLTEDFLLVEDLNNRVITKTSQLINDGDGNSPFLTEANVFTPSTLETDYGFTDNSSNWDIAFSNHLPKGSYEGTAETLYSAIEGKANATHTHTESQISDLDKYTQAEVDYLLSQKATIAQGLLADTAVQPDRLYIKPTVVTASTNYTLDTSKYQFILTSPEAVITLPDPATITERYFSIQGSNITFNVNIVNVTGTHLASGTPYSGNLTIMATASGWYVINDTPIS